MKKKKINWKKTIKVWWKYIFLKLLLIDFSYTKANQSCHRTTNGQPSNKWTSRKGKDMLVKVDSMYRFP